MFRIKAGQLYVGSKLLLYNGEEVVVYGVRAEYLQSEVAVYNFEVEDWHTYFVSESSVLVYNSCKLVNGAKMKTDDALSLADAFLGEGYKDMGRGRFVSANGTKQVRFTDSDLSIINNHDKLQYIIKRKSI